MPECIGSPSGRGFDEVRVSGPPLPFSRSGSAVKDGPSGPSKASREAAPLTAGERRLGGVGGSQADDGKLGDELPARGVGAVVAPADEPAEDASDDRGDEAVASLVVGEDGAGLGFGSAGGGVA